VHDDLRAVITKIRGFLSPRHNGGLDAMAKVFVPHARGYIDYEPQQELIDVLVDTIARRRWCELTYHAAWKGTTRRHRARPLRLVWHRSALYLLACLGEHHRITTLAVHRIRDLVVTGEEFGAPRLDLDAHAAKAFGIFVSDQEEDVEVGLAYFGARYLSLGLGRWVSPADPRNVQETVALRQGLVRHCSERVTSGP